MPGYSGYSLRALWELTEGCGARDTRLSRSCALAQVKRKKEEGEDLRSAFQAMYQSHGSAHSELKPKRVRREKGHPETQWAGA